MRPDDDQSAAEQPFPYTQLQKAQEKLKQFIPKYQRLLAHEARLRQENAHLREQIERFNRKLIEREKELTHLQDHLTEMLALLQQIDQEERRSPALHARAGIRQHFLRQQAEQPAGELPQAALTIPAQAILPLNIWLVSRNRFVEQIISYYARKRERFLVIDDYRLVKQLIEIGIFPDILITGAYDLGLDDPSHQSFFEFLEQSLRASHHAAEMPAFFMITLSASAPPPPENVKSSQPGQIRHKYISKLHGLQVTISEVRFFIEMRRCQPDIMEAELSAEIQSLEEVTRLMTDLRQQRKTGLLIVLSDETPPNIRWGFQLLYLHGKLVKTDHTLESAALITADGDLKPLEKEFIFSAFDSQYALNQPQQLFFFPLYENVVLQEIKE